MDDRPGSLSYNQLERRSGALADTLRDQVPGLDALGMSEVERTAAGNTGLEVARRLGLSSTYWHGLTRSRPNEGIFLATKKEAVAIQAHDLDPGHDHRSALTAKLGNITVAATHLSWEVNRADWRRRQTEILLYKLATARQAIILGDFNSLPWQKPRRMLERHGFKSVARQLDFGPTYPVEPYGRESTPAGRYRLVKALGGFSIDDIYTCGLRLVDGGTFEGPSDHRGVWATVTT